MKNIWNFFVDKYKFTFILIVAIVVFGVFSIIQLPKESQPEVDIPIATVTTAFPGASAIDVEQLVTNEIEDRVSSIEGISEYTSVSRSGLSSITVEFDPDIDKQQAIDDLEKRVDEAQVDLPGEAEDSTVNEIELSDQPFMQVSIGGPFSIVELTDFAERIKDNIETISGISEVNVVGGQEDELQVVVDKSRLENYSLGVQQVTQAISQANSDIPVGEIETAGEKFSLRLAGRIEQIDQIKNIPISSNNGSVVQVSDVAEVRSAIGQMETLSRISPENKGSERAVSLLMYDTAGGDITEISANTEEEIRNTINNELPDGVEFLVVEDQGDLILQDLNSLTRNGLATIAIVFVILLLVLGLREALIASIAIPLSFMMTFTFLNYIGLTLNFMTLFSLILALGVIVDTAIVINEGISTKIEQGTDPFQAAKDAIEEFQWPIIAGTFTTVFAFLPMLLTSGLIGEFIKSIPITVSGVLISSLFVALAIITTVNAVLAKYKKDEQKQSSFKKKLEQYTQDFISAYEKYLQNLLKSSTSKKKLAVLVFILVIFSYSLPAIGALEVNMFPPSNTDKFSVSVETPIGTPIEKTSETMDKIEEQLQQDNRIASYVVNIGSSMGSSGVGSTNQASMTVNLVPEDQRVESTQIIDQYQDQLSEISRADISVTQTNTGPSQEAPVVVTIQGDDLNTLDSAATEFKRQLQEIEGAENVGSTVKNTNGEFVINIDRTKAQRFGVSTQQLAGALRNVVNGSTATSVNQEGKDIDINVLTNLGQQGGKTNQTDIETIRSLKIATSQGMIPLSTFADIQLQNNRVEINHKDGNRIAKATSYTSADTSANQVFNEIQSKIDAGEIEVPEGYSVTLGGENEDINQSFADMGRAMILAIFLIASLLVLQFESFKQALIILITIPLALIGVFPGLTLLNLPLSFPGIIGIVALVGIVVNNAILLIDTVNRNREKFDIDTAIVKAGKERLRPILLTTVTTVLGIMPLAITEEVWRSLGFAIIFGLLFSTVLTLVVVPALYKRFAK